MFRKRSLENVTYKKVEMMKNKIDGWGRLVKFMVVKKGDNQLFPLPTEVGMRSNWLKFQ